MASINLTPELLKEMYYYMALSRALDDRMWILNRQGRAPVVYSANGHEAAQVGSVMALNRGEDWIVPYYRDLAMVLAYGETPREVMLHLLGRADDPNSGGRQMPAHWGLKRRHIFTTGSVVATQDVHATGLALASKILKDGRVSLASFGEGSTSQGEFHEALNFAAVHKLPVIFLNENNGYAISVPARKQMAIMDVAARAQGYGMPGVIVDGNDPVKVYEVTAEAVERARRGEGPTLIEAKTYRFVPHSSDDDDRAYRSREEVAEWKKRDPVITFEKRLLDEKIMTPDELKAMQQRIKDEVNDATDFAEKAPLPDPSTLGRYVYAE
ncbi:thiamine pyrophosphate-dependent dehydrogenase E1 component subunit alpha [Sulfobacillus thermosulfidooxidans]|uniref:2-oxoisovalerate dehydrogenase subunit alpha n=2 Tax=Sulfobacillus thermosulfidooxidans TaxID=28034 RepID=A0A1W1WAX2_SULTA|nr:thiamine pyrophosphate-dependent dehydrogenase E1 component subunit alpha [Sulfobacillus thermosulfidooxidans]SMC03441.1 2-oxoisovalerate dehydrogenase E1 component alpha subunit [Sulfobacillus thermosulfidooxidans DSM 9293]